MKRKPKLLVANRSEIACRVFQTAREMGLVAVGVVAPGDEEARHVSFCDELLEIPSYLDGPAIVGKSLEAGVQFLHPGYGFLSERASFAALVEKSGIAFLGPRAETIEAMGGKIPSKELAEKIGVPVLPWAKVSKGGDLKGAADRVGYPLLLKASSGGGGKGMRKVASAQELAGAIESAEAEALSAFGEGTVFLERLLEHARHIEVQVFGDGKGGGVHLHERDCSLQRRHQKIWEEARAANLSEETRAKLFDAAMKLVRATKYRSAGTCEFLVDQKGNPYFLEMNTRLQVEHPVTECITGLDLVRAQIELALEPTRSPILDTPVARGHAIEVRFYAEDPAAGYVPTPGKITMLRFPSGPGIRVDSGIEEGQTITTGFDSMLAKLIVSAPDRSQAISRLRLALEETVILGLGTNQSFLHFLCDHPKVLAGEADIQFLERECKGFKSSASVAEEKILQAMHAGTAGGQGSHSFPSPWAENASSGTELKIEKRPGGITTIEGTDGKRFRAFSRETSRTHSWNLGGHAVFSKKGERSRAGAGRTGSGADLTAQFPGKVRKILVREGQEVQAGEKLLLVEAMKMEFAIEAPASGTVTKIHVKEMQQLQPGDLFLDFKGAVGK